ncbi:glycine/D-amino acid oxidase-like deaminating enzyme [Spinactinospora alkalitolerans]|uniref:Glycine/D-amino acid oxidase-like deaminating enzyme n=1 Tax=Spinactinospora alkalitolerans TaxID=687207 RepID=A0A852TNW9_9ACTN|nr:styrene monooxygenase/indole monooxygenase family protein [Spinactinospora alkalitolerans]NYE45648.1 glycine/D-amino acid oxidase-like deaminating enzyme [Spinactinospora alkalitolerans]
MRKILIVGAGQSGLCLANGLLERGYEVTLITGKTSIETRQGRPNITQFTLPRALELERALHLDWWSAQAPHIEGVRQPLYAPGMPDPLVVQGRFNGYGIAVDPRAKMADWLEHFEDQGGKVVIHGVTVTDLDYFSRMYDLVVIAVGAGELGALFDYDPSRFGGAHPRVITQTLVHGLEEGPAGPGFAEVISAPEGRIFFAPVLTQQGPAHSISVMDEPGGSLDGSHLNEQGGHRGPSAQTVTDWIVRSVGERFADFATRLTKVEPVDATSAAVTRVRPQVRNPVGVLPSGGHVLGSADVVVTTDPIAGQGWNVSTMCATTYLEAIVSNGDTPFNAAWMSEAFETFYANEGIHSAALSAMLHSLWDSELPGYFQEVVGAALTYHEVADRWVHGLDDPRDYRAWFLDEEGARAYLGEVAARHS